MSESAITFRRFTAADIPFGMELKNIAGWNQIPADWERLLAQSADGCFVAMADGVDAGTATAVDFKRRIGWIGMVLVPPDHRRKGIGTTLLHHAIDHLRDKGVEAIKLDATPLGKKVYDRIGFVDEYTLERRQGRGCASRSEGTRPIGPRDIDRIIEWDAVFFGAPRGALLRALIDANPALSHLVERDGEIAGCIVARPGLNAFQIGPWIATDPHTAEQLFDVVLNALDGEPVFVDVPLVNPHVVTMVESRGFELQRPFIRMHLGGNPHPGRPELVYATSGPETG